MDMSIGDGHKNSVLFSTDFNIPILQVISDKKAFLWIVSDK